MVARAVRGATIQKRPMKADIETESVSEASVDAELSARERILDAARKAFSQNGYFGTSIRQISNLCGLKQPSIYHHFDSKENLFRNALHSSHKEMMDFILSRTGSGDNLAEDVIQVFHAFMDFHRDRRGALHLLGNLIYSAPDNLRDEYAETYAPEMTGAIERVFRRWDPENKQEELKICINHTLTAYLIELSVRDRGREEESLTQALRCVHYILRIDPTGHSAPKND
ncbi:MAG: AcrR family transcriptional regulator [Spirochaetaceae bacterium]|nr:AcrR family transcriptional regulator [Spirochaetaceae bacterium]